MTIKHLMKTGLFTGAVFLSSCAYMQTHKNIEENHKTHSGYHLNTNIQLYRAGGKYYIGAEKQQLRIHYPAIYDSIFLTGHNDPEYLRTGSEYTMMYRQISSGTATVLQRTDGYAELNILCDELQNSSAPWIESLPTGAQSCSIKAEIVGSSITWPERNSATEAPLAIRALSTIDQVLVDWPGTILYNIAIPIMAPFVFFHEFLNEQ